MPEGRVILPRCFCGWTLRMADDGDGFACPRCHRVYLDGATLPACKHARTEHLGGDRDLYRVRCRECQAAWTEVPISGDA